MCKSIEQPDEENKAPGLDVLVADILTGKVSIFDLLRSAPSGDYRAAVQQMRLFHVFSRDRRVLKQLQAEMRAKMVEAGVDPDDGAIERELARKDGSRRFSKLVEERAQTFNIQPSLLSGPTFEACLEQYKALIGHVERMWADACQFYTRGNYPFAAFFAILVIEEIGKLSRLAQDLVLYDAPRAAATAGTV
jgi:hypothetical protein